jgi:hypothetical protein
MWPLCPASFVHFGRSVAREPVGLPRGTAASRRSLTAHAEESRICRRLLLRSLLFAEGKGLHRGFIRAIVLPTSHAKRNIKDRMDGRWSPCFTSSSGLSYTNWLLRGIKDKGMPCRAIASWLGIRRNHTLSPMEGYPAMFHHVSTLNSIPSVQ